MSLFITVITNIWKYSSKDGLAQNCKYVTVSVRKLHICILYINIIIINSQMLHSEYCVVFGQLVCKIFPASYMYTAS